ncbi:MAG: beta-glucosidase [Thermoleophilaceae bacterium]|nr:beta-glucosidase [Thermoleophilaceae bacterium]
MRGRWIAVAVLLLAASPGAAAEAAGRCGDHPWCDTSLSPERRAQLLLDALTPAERIGLLAGDEAGGVTGQAGTHTGTGLGVPRLDLPPLYLTDGPVGVRQGPGTALPSSLALAASFNRRLARRDGGVVGNEAKLKGNDVVYAPTINLLRTPLWGRAFESLGEDPFLTGQLGVEWIRGAQAQGVIANVKHFAANNQENNRFTIDARVDERTLNELYLPQFEAAVKQGHAGSVMCSYNRLNGPHACENTWLLQQVLRHRWGFRGFVLADYGASKRIGSGLLAGLDFEPYPFFDADGGENYTPAAVEAALAARHTRQALVDRAVGHLLRTLFAYGFFDRAAYADDDSRVDKAGHAEEARRLAEAGTVLLENDGALPLDPARLKSLAVIGADGDVYKNGGGSSDVQPYSLVTPRAGIAARAGAGVDMRYDPGDDPRRAADVARGADAAVVVVADEAGEGADKSCLGLDCGAAAGLRRDELIDSVAAANHRTIVVLETAGPVLTPWRDRVEGIVESWYPGSAGGTAIARVLFGDVDPGGRLPATFPRRAQDLPTAGDPRRYPGVGDVVHYSEGVLVGYRWYDRRGIAPAFPFGHGLSYASFAFRRPRMRPAPRGLGARVSLEIVNTGRRTGVAVPQLYLGLPGARGRVQPPRQLKGFESVTLRPGRRARVHFRLGARAFSYWDVRRHRWQVAPGCYRMLLGRSSRRIVARATIAVRGARCPGAATAIP